MKITFFCSNCGTRLQIDESLKDKKVRCPSCQTVVGVPPDNANKIDEMNADSSDSLTQSTFAEEEGFSAPDSSKDFAFDSSISNNPYEPPKTIYYGYQQPDDGMRLTKVFFQSLCSDSISLLVRYYKEVLFLCLISFLLACTQTFLYNTTNARFMILSGILNIIQMIFYFLFVNYLIRLLRTGQTSFLLLKPKKISMIFKGAFASFLYVIEVWFLILLLIFPVILIFTLLGRPFLLAPNSSSAILFYIFAVICFVFILWFYFMILYRHMFFLTFILDRNAGVLQSFQLSGRYTKGNYKVFIFASTCFLLPIIIFEFVSLISMGVSNATNPDLNISSMQSTFLSSFISVFINSFMMTPLFLSLFVTMYLQMTGQATIIREASKTKL